MKLILKNGKPALVQENGEIIFHSMYTGNRFLGNMHNILKDYSQQKWTVRETGPFECSKNISALGGSYANRLEKVMFNTMSEHNGLRLYDMCSSTRVRSLLENDFAESAVHMPAIDRTGQAYNSDLFHSSGISPQYMQTRTALLNTVSCLTRLP